MRQTRNAILFDSQIKTTETEYSLPTLSTTELVHCFTAMQIGVTEQILLHPTPESVQEIFQTILDLVKSWRIKIEPRVYGDEMFMADANHILFLYSEVKCLLNALGHKDFKKIDLVSPTPHRLARILSSLANYAMFREERWTTFESRASRIEETSGKEEVELLNKSRLEEEIQQCREIAAQRKLQEQQLELDNTEYEKELRNISSEGDALKMDFDKLRENRRQGKDAMQDVQLRILTMNEAIRTFKSGKNYDTTQTMANVAKRKEMLDEFQSKISEAQKQVQSVVEQIEYLHQIEQDLERCTQLPREIQRLRNECEWVKTSIADTEGNIEKVLQRSSELRETLKKLHQLEEYLKIKVQKHEEHEEGTHESRYNKFLERNEKLEEVQKEISDIDATSLKLKAGIVKIEQELHDIRQESDTELKLIETHIKELESAEAGYLNGVIEALQ